MRQPMVFFVLSLWCFGLLAARVGYSGRLTFAFLVWNLFLAAIPWLASLGVRWHRHRSEGGGTAVALQIGLFAIWLLFLPNAPYILTDLIHLRQRPGVPMWFDLALILSFAGTGLLLGYASLLNVERVVEERFGRLLARLTVISALMLSAFGIYLGRFLRWNSWDIVTQPFALLRDMTEISPRMLAVTVIYGIALTLGYVAWRGAIPYAPCPNPPTRRWDDSMPSTSARRS